MSFERRSPGHASSYADTVSARRVDRAQEPPTPAQLAAEVAISLERDLDSLQMALAAVEAAQVANHPEQWSAARAELDTHRSRTARTLIRARAATAQVPEQTARVERAERLLVELDATARTFADAPSGVQPISREAAIRAVLEAPIAGSVAVGYQRKEAALRNELAQLDVTESRALAARLRRARPNDPIAALFTRLTPERQRRLLELLDDARRRAAIRPAPPPAPARPPDRERAAAATAPARPSARGLEAGEAPAPHHGGPLHSDQLAGDHSSGATTAVPRQAAPVPGSVLLLRRRSETERPRSPIYVSLGAEVLDVDGVIERVLILYGIPAERVRELDHLAITADPPGSPGITSADVSAAGGVVRIAISPRLDAHLRDTAARMTGKASLDANGAPRISDRGAGKPAGAADEHRPATPAGNTEPQGGPARIGVTVPERLKEMFTEPPRARTVEDREIWNRVFSELLAMTDEDLTNLRIFATHLTDDTARFLSTILLYKKLKADYVAALERALQDAADDPHELAQSDATRPAASTDPATFKRWTREQKEREARARMDRLRNQQLSEMLANPGRTVKDMAKTIARPDLQLVEVNQSLTRASQADGGWEAAASNAGAASKLSGLFAGLLAVVALVGIMSGVGASAIMSASLAMMMSSASLSLVEANLYVKAAGDAKSPADYDRFVAAGGEAQLRAFVALAGMGAAVSGGLIARIPLPGRLASVGGALRLARNTVARNVGEAWSAIRKPTADKLRGAVAGLRELLGAETRSLTRLRAHLDGMTAEQFFTEIATNDRLRQAVGLDPGTAQALSAMARSEHGKTVANQIFEQLRGGLRGGAELATSELDVVLQRVERHASSIETAATKDDLDRALATAEAELSEEAVTTTTNSLRTKQTSDQLAQLLGDSDPAHQPASKVSAESGKAPADAPAQQPASSTATAIADGYSQLATEFGLAADLADALRAQAIDIARIRSLTKGGKYPAQSPAVAAQTAIAERSLANRLVAERHVAAKSAEQVARWAGDAGIVDKVDQLLDYAKVGLFKNPRVLHELLAAIGRGNSQHIQALDDALSRLKRKHEVYLEAEADVVDHTAREAVQHKQVSGGHRQMTKNIQKALEQLAGKGNSHETPPPGFTRIADVRMKPGTRQYDHDGPELAAELKTMKKRHDQLASGRDPDADPNARLEGLGPDLEIRITTGKGVFRFQGETLELLP